MHAPSQSRAEGFEGPPPLGMLSIGAHLQNGSHLKQPSFLRTCGPQLHIHIHTRVLRQRAPGGSIAPACTSHRQSRLPPFQRLQYRPHGSDAVTEASRWLSPPDTVHLPHTSVLVGRAGMMDRQLLWFFSLPPLGTSEQLHTRGRASLYDQVKLVYFRLGVPP